METVASSSGLIPVLFGITGVLLTLRYLKGLSDFVSALNYLFCGFVCVFFIKVLTAAHGSLGDPLFYFLLISLNLLNGVMITAAAFGLKGIKFFTPFVTVVSVLLIFGWGWYVVYLTGDTNLITLSLAVAPLGYSVLAWALWRRKNGRNSIGFVLTGWLCVFLTLYNIVRLTPWGQSLLPTSCETFMYVAIMGGWLLISNNMMAQQYDSLMQEIKDNKERLRLMVQLSPFPIVISRLKGDQLMLINDSAAKLFGVNPRKLSNFKMVDYFAEPQKRQELLSKLEKNPVVDDFEFQVKPKAGEPFWLLVSARVFDYEYEVALYMAFQDITDRKKKEIQLFNQATRDPLTQCYNRRQFEELSKNEVTRSRRYNHPFCLFMIDADHFKSVNDTHGHAVGDLVLQSLADCCRRTLRESDIISRFGGEEFVIMLPEATLENGYRVAERLRINISKIVVKNEQDEDVTFTVSIGLVPSTVTDDVADMLKKSDEALYEAKEHGRNQVVVYGENGPDRSYTVSTDERIEKAKNAAPYYFTPPNQGTAPRIHSDEPEETGVVGLNGAASGYGPDLDDDDEPAYEAEQSGVSLNSLYEDDGSPAPVPVPPPTYQEKEDYPAADGYAYDDEDAGYAAAPEQPAVEEVEDDLPPETGYGQAYDDEDAGYAAAPEQPAVEEVEDDLPPEDYGLPDAGAEENVPADDGIELPPEDYVPPPPEKEDAEGYLRQPYDNAPLPDEPAESGLSPDAEANSDFKALLFSEEDAPALKDGGPELPPDIAPVEEPSFLDYGDVPPPSAEPSVPVFDGDENDYADAGDVMMPPPPAIAAEPPSLTGEPPPLAITPQGVVPPDGVRPPAVAPKPKIIKKIIKMPAGMVKVPKMPGVIKMKIPKGLVQTPIAPKPPQS